jgi:hypothetical protein
MIQLELETPLGKALIEENSYSIVEINNAAKSVSKPAPWRRLSDSYFVKRASSSRTGIVVKVLRIPFGFIEQQHHTFFTLI